MKFHHPKPAHLLRSLVEEGDTIEVGKPIAIIETDNRRCWRTQTHAPEPEAKGETKEEEPEPEARSSNSRKCSCCRSNQPGGGE